MTHPQGVTEPTHTAETVSDRSVTSLAEPRYYRFVTHDADFNDPAGPLNPSSPTR